MPTPRRTILKRLGAAAVVTTGAAVLNGTTSASAATASGEDDILLDSFSGTDDQKLTAALDVARNSSPRRPIRLSPRSHTFSQTRTTFSGLRILGPNVGWQNPEIANTAGALPQCNVTLNCGNGASSWLVGTQTTYNVMVAGITFKSSNAVTQFYHHPYSAGTSYATTLDTLSFYGFKHVLGTPADPFSMTLVTTRGSWTCVAVQDTQFSLRGSDNFLWVAGDMNYGWQGANAGRYLMRFSNLSKTAVRHLYLTARGGSRAILVEGPDSQQGGLDFSDCVVEGQNAGDPAMGALIVVKGGGVSFTNTKLNFGMARPSDFTDQRDTGLVMVQGGTALLTNTWTNRASATPESVPVVSVSGGTAYVNLVMGMGGNWTGKPRVSRTGGTLVPDASVSAA
ncbi:hypothetical protein [Phycicoccus sp. Soil803]|uniref:hypothetical protein n=1 Tax=Phycicoccus sp. Soil803 TaxID=1736415 RepID=UPI00070C77BD|nr:hypothetical protein [Phycicoccus sp. Soil803]KRF25807.1 hypothetical protein ASG95_15995 [Phycicoccus sp. Soil803]